MNSSSYKPDIDGLRAIAVAFVVGFHAFPSIFQGGYIGVDIFFVISGYLITGHIWSDLAKSRFSLLEFYAKRIIRIFPSLTLILVFCAIVGGAVLFIGEYQQLGRHIAAGIGFFSNILLWNERGYFDVSSDLKPLLHLWSLGIEEQFYLFLPILLILLWRFGAKFAKRALLVIFILSLCANLAFIGKDPSMTFYLLPTRLWELLAGGLLALSQFKTHNQSLFMKWTSKVLSPWTYRFALLLLFSGALLFTKDSPFPGWRAIVPTFGSFLLIAIGSIPDRKPNFLSSRPMVFIGLISYPLYLWHWPILTFAREILPKEFEQGIGLRCFCIGMAVLLSVITYRYWENPIRQKATSPVVRRKCVLSFLGVGFAILALGLTINWKGGFPSRLPKTAQIAEDRIPNSESFDSEKAMACKRKWLETFCPSAAQPDICRKQFVKYGFCDIGNPDKVPTVALLGDSHANHFFVGLKSALEANNQNLILLAMSSTVPLAGVYTNDDELRDPTPYLNWAASTPSIHTVILAGFWSAYFRPDRAEGVKKGFINKINASLATNQKEIFTQGLSDSLTQFLWAGKKVIFVYDIPFFQHLRACLPRPYRDSFSPLCGISQLESDILDASYRPVIKRVLEKFPQVEVWDPYKVLCENGTCLPYYEDIFLYTDSQHLGKKGSHIVISKMLGQ